MRKTLTYLLCAITALAVLSGCGNSKPVETAVPTNAPSTATRYPQTAQPTMMPSIEPNVSNSPDAGIGNGENGVGNNESSGSGSGAVGTTAPATQSPNGTRRGR